MLRKFVCAIFADWLARMSGPLAVPFSIAALYVRAGTFKVLFGFLAVLAGCVTSYRIWEKEYKRAEAAELQSSEPEIIMTFRNGPLHDDYFVIQHTGGGSARNIKVMDITDGNWVGESRVIPYLSVGGTERVQTQFKPVTPAAIQAQNSNGYMVLGAFVMRSLDGISNLVTVAHEDGASKIKCETDFDIVCDEHSYNVSLIQKGRRVRPLALRSQQ